MKIRARYPLAWLAGALLALALVACGGSDGDGDAPPPPPSGKLEPVVTPPGTPAGEPASASLNGAGGSLASADGRLRITVPEGALDQPTTLTIQPISNGAPGHFGPVYRLLPEGLAFAKPVTLSFAYADADLQGSSADVLLVATHQADGTWQTVGQPVIDPAARTVRIETTHFSDWTATRGFLLRPASASVKVGTSLALSVRSCISPGATNEAGELLYDCEAGPSPDPDGSVIIPLPPIEFVKNWAVNGAPGGNPSVGTIVGRTGNIVLSANPNATYQAPASKPQANPVAVSVEIDAPSLGGKVLLVSNIKVIDDASSYTGSITGTITVVDEEAETTITITASDIRLQRDDAIANDLMHYSLSQGTVHETVTRVAFDPERTRTVAQSSQDAEVGALLEVFDPVRPQGPEFAGRFWLEATGFSNNFVPYPLPHAIIPLSNYCPDRRAADGASAFLSYGQDASVLEGSFSANCVFAGAQPYHIDMQWSLRADDE